MTCETPRENTADTPRDASSRDILFCACRSHDNNRNERVAQSLRALENAGVPLRRVSDFCGLAASRDPDLAARLESRPVLLVACHPRAVRWLLDYAGFRVHPGFASLDMLALEPGELVRQAQSFLDVSASGPTGQTSRTGQTGPTAPPSPADWHPWFPVIDRERCTKCGQCARYCLFDTYDVREDGTVVVARPANCKTDCPACARICPESALIFPKCPEALIAGDAPSDPAAARREQAVRLEQFAQGDLRAALARRRARIPLLKKPAESGPATPPEQSGATP